MLTFNEGKVCEAIIRYLETREGARRADLRSPEQEHHAFPVELVFKIGQQLFALEHTGIEPFEGHMQLEGEASRHIEPIRAALADALPPNGVFELHIPAKALQGRKAREIWEIQESIVAWVKQTAPTLPIKQYADYIGNIMPVTPPGVPFALTLYRFQSIRLPGYFLVKHVLSENSEGARQDRIRIACDKKFPKLASWKRHDRARTILVLEDNDIQLTNHAIVAETFLPLAYAREDRPDEVYIVATCMEPWRAWPILIDDVSYFDLLRNEDKQAIGWEIDQSSVESITGR